MAFSLTNYNRNVVPIWRSFNKTLELGELTRPSTHYHRVPYVPNLESLLNSWKEKQSLHNSTDLFSALIINSALGSDLAREVADSIIQNSKVNVFQKRFVQKAIEKFENRKTISALEYNNINEYVNLLEGDGIRKIISDLKFYIRNNPKNAIIYVDLARYYTLIGQLNKADFYLDIALNLAPSNRFILRSAARFFIHSGVPDKGKYYLNKSQYIKTDPWLLASELAISELIGKSSKHTKRSLLLVNSQKHKDFDLTELRSALATVELFSGKLKSSRKLYRQSLVKPNDNSVAQIEWASNKFSLFDVDPEDFGLQHNYEAIFYDAVAQRQWEKAFENSLLWYIDTPYAEEPVIRGSHVAFTFLNDFERSEKLLEYGLLNNPKNPLIMNNLAYCQASSGKPMEARKTLQKLVRQRDVDIPRKTIICLTATMGLIEIKSGNIMEGITYYQKASDLAKKDGDQYLESLATLNLALALPGEHKQRKDIINQLEKIRNPGDTLEIEALISRLKGTEPNKP